MSTLLLTIPTNHILAVVPLFVWIAIILAGAIYGGYEIIKGLIPEFVEPINKFLDVLSGPVGYGVAVLLVALAIYFGRPSTKNKGH